MIASEVTPFAKTGGLADVLGTLSVALARLGHEVCVIAPAYRSALQGGFVLREMPDKLSVALADRRQEATVLEGSIGNRATVYLIRADAYFDREFLYGTPSGDYPDNAERFTFFSRAALELLRRERVDIVHGHDWQTALAIVFLKAQPARYPELAAAKTVFTVHNLGFQGIFGPPDWRLLDLDASFFTPQFLEFYGNINFLKGALVFADKLTTVSPSYATGNYERRAGFWPRRRAAPARRRSRRHSQRRRLPSMESLDRSLPGGPLWREQSQLKSSCKKKLRRALGLADKSDTPLFAMISRLTPQKGFDLIENIFAELMERQVQFVVLGTGAPRYEDFFRAAAARYPEQVGGAHRFRRAPGAPDRGGRGSFLDAVALRALRPQPDV